MLWHRLKEPSVACHGQVGAGWRLLERISGSPQWVGWQWLSVMPAGPREVLTQHKCPCSTPRPLSMNQLNHSTEKLTQTHRHPSNPQKVTGRRTPGAEAAGHHHPYPSPGSPAPASLREHLCPQTQGLLGVPSYLTPLFCPLLANLSGLIARVLSLLPGFIYQVLTVLLGCSRSGWARGMHKMTNIGILTSRSLASTGLGEGNQILREI